MSSPKSPYLNRDQALARPAKKRKSEYRGKLEDSHQTDYGHRWGLRDFGRDALNVLCKRCGQARFFSENSMCRP